ncbi:MAG TPA: 30S ribosomal protein S6--L-glutamate ligase [Balneolaceae bacterium]|nr:30S ribosomal protein S6--L-glutamate ligase [Balneolaceae bacterium]
MHIVILSRNKNLYSTSRLIEAGEEAGHRISVLDHLKCDIVSEQDNPVIFYGGNKITDIDAVIPRIGASATFYGSAVVRQFELMKVFTAVKSQALLRSRDKLRSLQILARSGVGMPKTVFTNYSSEAKKIINILGGPPLIIKLLEGTQGLGVVLAPTRKAAESIIQAFHSINVRVIVQEYIEEARGEDVRAFVVNGEVIGAMKRKGKEEDFRSNLHRGGTSELIQLSQQWRQTALVAAEAMGLSIAGVDILSSNRGPLVLEVNSSPGLQGIEAATQKDIAGSIIQFVETAALAKTEKNKAH